jgi:hypothetical protein
VLLLLLLTLNKPSTPEKAKTERWMADVATELSFSTTVDLFFSALAYIRPK